MPSLKYRSARTEPLAPLGFGSHELGDVRFRLCKRVALGWIYKSAPTYVVYAVVLDNGNTV